MSLADFINGKATDLSPSVLIFLFVCVTGWQVEYIENLPATKIREMSPMIQMAARAMWSHIK